MTKKRTSANLAELKSLANQARENIWKRIKIAKEVMADLDWIARVHGGSDFKAQEALQQEYFHELNGTYTLGVLFRIYEAFPKKDDWEAHEYNLQDMRALWEKTRSKQKIERKGPVSRKDHEELEQKYRHVNSRADSLAEENGVLRQRIRELEHEVARLNGIIEVLSQHKGENYAATDS